MNVRDAFHKLTCCCAIVMSFQLFRLSPGTAGPRSKRNKSRHRSVTRPFAGVLAERRKGMPRTSAVALAQHQPGRTGRPQHMVLAGAIYYSMLQQPLTTSQPCTGAVQHAKGSGVPSSLQQRWDRGIVCKLASMLTAIDYSKLYQHVTTPQSCTAAVQHALGSLAPVSMRSSTDQGQSVQATCICI